MSVKDYGKYPLSKEDGIWYQKLVANIDSNLYPFLLEKSLIKRTKQYLRIPKRFIYCIFVGQRIVS
ncbi:MAG: hypothetical protein AB7V56_02055 [Candidatus Nitrosocosmicus sp.]